MNKITVLLPNEINVVNGGGLLTDPIFGSLSIKDILLGATICLPLFLFLVKAVRRFHGRNHENLLVSSDRFVTNSLSSPGVSPSVPETFTNFTGLG